MALGGGPQCWTNVLQIAHRSKGIPYGGTGQLRADGHANYGFTNLRGHPGRLADIPELRDDVALLDCIAALNSPGSAFGTIGCLSGPVDEDSGHRVSGYVEFAFDSAQAIADASSYFTVFFHFDRTLGEAGFEHDVHFYWELIGATFHHARASGFTAAVTINTGWHSTAADARTAWSSALELFSECLCRLPPAAGTAIFLEGSSLS